MGIKWRRVSDPKGVHLPSKIPQKFNKFDKTIQFVYIFS